MRALRLVGMLSISVLGTTLVACGDDAASGEDTSRGRAGASGVAGKAGAGGRAGAAGTSGAAGAAGRGGSSVGGSAGQSGSGGAGATAGSAGTTSGGTAGAPAAGAGGAGQAGTSAAGKGGAAGTGGGAGTGGNGGAIAAGAGGSSGVAGQTSAGAGGTDTAGAGGTDTAGAGGQETGGAGGQAPDPFTYAYNQDGNFVRYQPDPGKFEKVADSQRDKDRKLMPIDLHSWSIANFNVDRRMFTDFRLQNDASKVLFEIHDLRGAIHVALTEDPAEKARGNNHQAEYARFLIGEGDYTVVFTSLPSSVGHPELIVWRQKPDQTFAILVGSEPSEQPINTIDGKGIVVNPGETVTRTFHVTWIDEDNVIYKSNANGFDPK